MKKETFEFFKKYSSDITKINRLFVTAFIKLNKITVHKNEEIKQLIIKAVDNDYEDLLIFLKFQTSLDIEGLIELFEFVVSPKDKIVTGAVYTPRYIREYIINNIFEKGEELKDITVCDPACGCAGFLFSVSKKIKSLTNASYKNIFKKNIFGLDVQPYSIIRSRLLLTLLAISEGEDEYSFEFNLFQGNAFDFKWESRIYKFSGFEKIVGNPPYVCSRNIDEESKRLLENWEVSKSGHPDLYIPFFQLGMENLNEGGTLGYITVNTFFKSINGRLLREYFSKNSFEFKIIDFRNEQIFKHKNTYTCICIIKKVKSKNVKYLLSSSEAINKIQECSFSLNPYDELDNFSGWNLGQKSIISIINKIEKFEEKIFSKFSFSTGIATLKNSIYRFKPGKIDRIYYQLESKEQLFKIEKKICREIINSNKISNENDIDTIKEKIIFPYKWDEKLLKYKVISEVELKSNFPCAYIYLKSKKQELAKRDKGQRVYSKWYEYGRNQGLNVKGLKLFLPHITKAPSFIISNDEKLMFCNGEAIISESIVELEILKKILESKIFWFYISKTSKPYSSNYFSLSKNYIKNFSIPPLSVDDKIYLIKETNKDLILDFLINKYNINNDELKRGYENIE